MSLLLRNEPYQLTARASSTKKEPGSDFSEPGIYLATTYSHKTYRLTTIGAAAFHFRVRNGTGWFHHALVTRGQFQGKTLAASHLELGLWGPEVILNVELKSKIQNSSLRAARPAARSLASTRRFLFFQPVASRPFTVLINKTNSKTGIKPIG